MIQVLQLAGSLFSPSLKVTIEDAVTRTHVCSLFRLPGYYYSGDDVEIILKIED